MRRILLAVSAGIVAVLFLFYLACIHYTETGWVGIKRNWINGEIGVDHPGWNLTLPWVTVAKIDARPTRVCVTSASRAFHCKLVHFEPSAYQQLVATEGWRYYWWDNRVSFNFGYDEEYRGCYDLLRGYAFSAKSYPFLVIENDYQDELPP